MMSVHGTGGVALGRDDLDAVLLALLDKVLVHARGIGVAVVIQDSCGLCAELLFGKARHGHALEGVDEAGAEHIGVDLVGIRVVGDADRRGGGGDHRDVVRKGLADDRNGGCGGHGAHNGDDPGIHQGAVAGDGLCRVALWSII